MIIIFTCNIIIILINVNEKVHENQNTASNKSDNC